MSLIITLCSKRLSALEVKLGHGRQDKLAGNSGITSDEEKGGIVSCGPFLIQLHEQNAQYPKCFQTSNIFCILFGWLASPCSFSPLISRHAFRQWQIDLLCVVGHLKRWHETKWLTIADKMKRFWENELQDCFLFCSFFFFA